MAQKKKRSARSKTGAKSKAKTGGAKSKKSRAVGPDNAKVIAAWQKAASSAEAAEQLGMTKPALIARINYLRKAKDCAYLRRFPVGGTTIDAKELQTLAKKLAPAGGIPRAGKTSKVRSAKAGKKAAGTKAKKPAAKKASRKAAKRSEKKPAKASPTPALAPAA